ncbi:MAG: hypothetical protein ACPW60_14165 [Methylohalobius sp. ZOD2]
MEIFLFRILERMIAVAIGGIAIYLGYRLFYAVDTTGDGRIEVKLPRDLTVMISRIGPGVFFALFGAGVVGVSLAFPVRYSEQKSKIGSDAYHQREWSGIGAAASGIGTPTNHVPSISPDQELTSDRLRVQQHIAFLNQLPPLLDSKLSTAQQRHVRETLLATKLHLMKSVWDRDWGSFEDFLLWAEGGGKAVDSEAFRTAAAFFTHGREEPR